MVEDAALRDDYRQLATALKSAHERAEIRSRATGNPVEQEIDIRQATRILNQNPLLVRYLRDVAEREWATKGAGPPTLDDLVNMGGWAGTVDFSSKTKANAVQNPRQIREWADRSTWVRIAILKLRRYCERAAIEVVPIDEKKRYNKQVRQKLQLLFDQPNELRDSFRSLIGPVAEDVLVIDRGVIEKNMNLNRQPTALYALDGAALKIYPNWAGDPKEPRYLYEPDKKTQKPLRNDEAIVIIQNLSSWRIGYSAVQYLADTIQADIDATLSAQQMVRQKPPPHIIQIPGASGRQLDDVRVRYDSEFSGRREMMFLGGPNTAHVFPLIWSAKDQQWLEWQIYLARKIATIFGLAPQELGIVNDVNRSTAQVMQADAQSSGYIPLLLLLEEFANREIVADFAPRLDMDRSDIAAVNLKALYPEVSEAERALNAERVVDIATASLSGLPSATLNQMLALRGEDPVEGGDTFWVATHNGPMPWLSYDGYPHPETAQPATPQAPQNGEADQNAPGAAQAPSENSQGQPEPSPQAAPPGKSLKRKEDSRQPGQHLRI